MRIAIIAALAGSKQIPRKNAREFAEKPVIVWPIKEEGISGLFDNINVSTDIADIRAAERSQPETILPKVEDICKTLSCYDTNE